MNAQFQKIFGNDNEPFDFQKEVAEKLLAGKSVILRAPTGAGKTRAALFPFLLARQNGALFPRQMIYSLPLRTLAGSLYLDTNEALEKHAPKPEIRIQTGPQPDDPQFLNGDVIFCTYDQSLSSLLTIPLSLSRRQSNVNAGAMIGSYLVFDEFHLMDAARSLTTMTALLQWIKPWSPFLLMTATLSESLVKRMAELLGADVVTVSENDLKKIPSQNNKKRTFQVVERTLSAVDIIEKHAQSSIAVCNTVERAQDVFEALKEAKREKLIPSGCKIILLHSRFLPKDRKRIENLIRARFGKDENKRRNAILVATQVIEVGLDLSCQSLHTEIAPAAAVIQRAGRCARFPGESGTVFIYDVPLADDGSKLLLPYDGKDEPPLAALTWKELLKPEFNGQLIGFKKEQNLVDAVYLKSDQDLLSDAALNSRRSEIAASNGLLNTHDRSKYRDLIRSVSNCTFIVYEEPEDLHSPFALHSFSVSPGTLGRVFKSLGFEDSNDGNWFARVVMQDKEDYAGEGAQSYKRPKYTYSPGVEKANTFYKEFFFVIHPKWVDYSHDTGLRLRLTETPSPPFWKPGRDKKRDVITYELETYQEHIERVNATFDKLFVSRERIQYAAQTLAKLYNVAPETLEKLMRATIAGHDVGKLADKWQQWVVLWQRDYKKAPFDSLEFYAHTDYDERIDKDLQSQLNARSSRPAHAVESARAVYHLLMQSFPLTLAKASYSAIARHHSAEVSRLNPFHVSLPARKEAERVWSLITGQEWSEEQRSLVARTSANEAKGSLGNKELTMASMNSQDFLIHLLLVRMLRISDSHSLQQEGED